MATASGVAPHEIRQRMLKHPGRSQSRVAGAVAPHEIRQRMLKRHSIGITIILNQRCTTRDSSENAETSFYDYLMALLIRCTTRDSSENAETLPETPASVPLAGCTTRDSSENAETRKDRAAIGH